MLSVRLMACSFGHLMSCAVKDTTHYVTLTHLQVGWRCLPNEELATLTIRLESGFKLRKKINSEYTLYAFRNSSKTDAVTVMYIQDDPLVGRRRNTPSLFGAMLRYYAGEIRGSLS